MSRSHISTSSSEDELRVGSSALAPAAAAAAAMKLHPSGLPGRAGLRCKLDQPEVRCDTHDVTDAQRKSQSELSNRTQLFLAAYRARRPPRRSIADGWVLTLVG